MRNLERNLPSSQVRLCIVGPSGSGKSTVVSLLRRELEVAGYSVATLKLAQPLYDLQAKFYDIASVVLSEGDQDQILMETIARELRRINPNSLVSAIERRLDDCRAEVVLNDDLRDDQTDAPRLRKLGFRIARVVTAEPERISRLLLRRDAATIADSPLDRQIARLPVDFVINNSSPGLDRLKTHVDVLAGHIATLAKRQGELTA